MEYAVANPLPQSPFCYHIYPAVEKGFQIHQQTAEIQKTPSLPQLHQNIHITALIRLPTGQRAEKTDIVSPVFGGDG